MLDLLLPWEPLWWLIGAFAAAAILYVRGWRRAPDTTSVLKGVSFFIGLVGMYAVMQTRYDYVAQHMFFIHRLQHLVLHHAGPFLIAVSAPAAVLRAGLPDTWRRTFVELRSQRIVYAAWRTLGAGYRLIQHPVPAAVLFVGLIIFWLQPDVHFDAMLSARDYWIMNLSMAVDGLLFWWVMLDPRRPGTTAVTYGTGVRILVLWAVMLPQIGVGAWIALSPEIIYDVYAVCGRIWPVSPIVDQQIGGLITWIPAAMMSVIATLVLLGYRFRHEQTPLPTNAEVQCA